jgi:hypothetical protein
MKVKVIVLTSRQEVLGGQEKSQYPPGIVESLVPGHEPAAEGDRTFGKPAPRRFLPVRSPVVVVGLSRRKSCTAVHARVTFFRCWRHKRTRAAAVGRPGVGWVYDEWVLRGQTEDCRVPRVPFISITADFHDRGCSAPGCPLSGSLVPGLPQRKSDWLPLSPEPYRARGPHGICGIHPGADRLR